MRVLNRAEVIKDIEEALAIAKQEPELFLRWAITHKLNELKSKYTEEVVQNPQQLPTDSEGCYIEKE